MPTQTLRLAKRNLSTPDKATELPHGKLEYVELDETPLARITLEPGWKWSESVRPMVDTETCQSHHIQYVISGRLMIAMDDGSKMELEAGDFAAIPPGHDAWVVGAEPFVALDFTGLKEYVERS